MRWVYLLITALLAIPLQAVDYTPIMARVTAKHFKIVNGERKLFREQIGVYYRATNGSKYQRMIDVFGSRGGGAERITVYDATSGEVYQLDPIAKKAMLTGRGRAFPTPPTSLPEGPNTVGRKQISGYDCIGWRRLVGNGRMEFTSWFAPALQFLLIQHELHREDYWMVQTFEDIQTDLEPDPTFFVVPKDYTIVPMPQR